MKLYYNNIQAEDKYTLIMFKRAFNTLNANRANILFTKQDYSNTYTQKEYTEAMLKMYAKFSLAGFGALSFAIIYLKEDIKDVKQDIKDVKQDIKDVKQDIKILNEKIDNNNKLLERFLYKVSPKLAEEIIYK